MTQAPARIVVVTPSMGGLDGVAEVTRQFVDAFGDLGDPGTVVEVWSLDDPSRPECLEGKPVTFRTAAGNRVTFASFGLRSDNLDASTIFVVMHLHLLPVMWPLIFRGARVVAVLLGIEAWKPVGRLTANALRRCWRVLSISQCTIDRFRAANPSLQAMSVRCCAPSVAGSVRPTMPPRFDRYALIVARMASEERYKGHDELIKVWPQVLAHVPDARLVIAGGGDDVERLARLVERAGLNANIEFAGRVSREHLAALYRDTCFFVMPSRDEGFGLVYLEAMRAAKPCIASPGAAEEIFENGVQGFITDPDDPAALTAAIVHLFQDASLRHRLGAAAAARVGERFTEAHFRERLSDMLELRAVSLAC